MSTQDRLSSADVRDLVRAVIAQRRLAGKRYVTSKHVAAAIDADVSRSRIGAALAHLADAGVLDKWGESGAVTYRIVPP